MAAMKLSGVTPSSCKRFSISELTYSPCLTDTGFMPGQVRYSFLIEMKNFLENRGKTCSRLGFTDENIAHLGLPTFAGLAGRHNLQVTLKILDLHISEKLRIAQVDGIVPASGALKVCQKLRPDLPVTPAIFLPRTWLDPHYKSDALHKKTLPSLASLRPLPGRREGGNQGDTSPPGGG